jgi:hypothetical protein
MPAALTPLAVPGLLGGSIRRSGDVGGVFKASSRSHDLRQSVATMGPPFAHGGNPNAGERRACVANVPKRITNLHLNFVALIFTPSLKERDYSSFPEPILLSEAKSRSCGEEQPNPTTTRSTKMLPAVSAPTDLHRNVDLELLRMLRIFGRFSS